MRTPWWKYRKSSDRCVACRSGFLGVARGVREDTPNAHVMDAMWPGDIFLTCCATLCGSLMLDLRREVFPRMDLMFLGFQGCGE